MRGQCAAKCIVYSCQFDGYKEDGCQDDFLVRLSVVQGIIASDFNSQFDFEKCSRESNSACTLDLLRQAHESGQCAQECMSASCLYSLGACTDLKPPLCDLSYGGDSGKCLRCQSPLVQYFGYCLTACPRALAAPRNLPTLCIANTDRSDETHPDVMLVREDSRQQQYHTGDLYYNLVDAMAAAWQTFTEIRLVGLECTFNLKYMYSHRDNADYLMHTKFPDIFSDAQWKNLTIRSVLCAEQENEGCATLPTTIHFLNIATFRLIDNSITLINVILSTKKYFEYDPVSYCPTLTFQGGRYITDRGTEMKNVRSGLFQCAQFSSTSLFSVESGGVLHLKVSGMQDVEVSDCRLQLHSIFTIAGGDLYLENVAFTEVQASTTSATHAVILQSADCSPSECGSFTYKGGRVEYANNGYEFNMPIRMNPFLLISTMQQVEITNVKVTLSVTGDATAKLGLWQFGNVLSVVITDCEFSSNFVMGRLILVQSSLQLSGPEYMKLGTSVLKMTHIQLLRNTFKSNFAVDGIVVVSLTGDMLNIAIEDCTFSGNSLLKSSIINLEFLGSMNADRVTGYIDPRSGEAIPPSFLRIKNSEFTHHSSFSSLIGVDSFYNVEISGIVCKDNGVSEKVNLQATILTYIDAEGVYASIVPDYGDDLQCSSLVSLSDCVNVAASSLTFARNSCLLGGTGVSLNSGSNLQVSSLTVTDSLASGSAGTALTCNNCEVTARHVTVMRTANTVNGGIYLGNFATLALEDSLLQDNSGYTGTGIYGTNVKSLTVRRTQFIRNSAQISSGGAIYFKPMFYEGATLLIQQCQFESNLALIGGVIAIEFLTSGNPLSLIITDSVFTSNKATTNGASLNVASSTAFTDDSGIFRSSFIEEKSVSGAIALTHESGKFTIESSTFRRNSGTVGASITIQSSKNAVVYLVDVDFEDSSGAPALSKPNSLAPSVVITKNCRFTRNLGWAIYFESGSWSDDSSIFLSTNDTAAVVTSHASATLTGTRFLSNVSPDCCGALQLASQSSFTCTHCTFFNNSAEMRGGAVFSDQDSALTLTDCTFEDNRAGDSGSAVYAVSSVTLVTTITSSVFRRNAAGTSGTVYGQSAMMRLRSILLESNTASSNPGIDLLLSTMLCVNCTFRSQTGSDAPFLKVQVESLATLVSCEFSSGTGTTAACMIVSSSVVNLTDCSVTDVRSTGSGVVVGLASSEIYMQKVKMQRITSTTLGSIADLAASKLVIEDSVFRNFTYGGIVGISLEQLEVSRSLFESGQGYLGAALACFTCAEVTVTRSQFVSLNSSVGAVYLDSSPAAVSGSLFQNNSASQAGALYAFGLNLKVSTTRFVGNTARVTDGGALYFDCSDPTVCKYSVTDSEFAENAANRSGGALAWQLVKPQLTNVTVSSNRASYGRDYASFPIKLKLNAQRLLQDFENLPPGQAANTLVSVALVDHYGQIVSVDSSSTGEITSEDSEQATFSGTTKVIAVNGVYNFANFSVFGDPGTDISMVIRSSAIPLNSSGDEDDHFQAIPIAVRLRECLPGESISVKSCQVCGASTYGFDPAKPCQNCPANAQCLGMTEVIPDSGYWRSGLYSEKVWECPRPSSCLGGDPYDNGTRSVQGFCATGYSGNLCQSCASSYSRTGKNQCGGCPALEINIIRIAFVTVAVVLFNAYLVYGALKSATLPTAVHSIYLKILVNYLQLVFLVTEFNLSWPKPVLKLFSAQESTGGVTQQIYSVDCFLADNGNTSGIFYLKLIFMSILPVGVIAAVILFWVVVAAYFRKVIYLTREMTASVVIAFFFIHPTLTISLFSMFSCTGIDAGEYWLTVDMAIKCYTAENLFYQLAVGVPSVIVWIFGVPLLCLGILVKFRRHHDELWVKLQYGFLINGYRRQRFYWEFVVLLRKIAIICFSVFMTNSVELQALSVQLALLFFYLLHHAVLPYTHIDLNKTESRGIIVADVTIYCGLYYLTDKLSEFGSWLLFVLIVVVNAVFLVYWFLAVLRFFVEIVAVALPQVGRKLMPELFERDPYIEYFVDAFFQPTNEKYARFNLEDLRSQYRRFLRNFESSNLPSLTHTYNPLMPIVVDIDTPAESAMSERLGDEK